MAMRSIVLCFAAVLALRGCDCSTFGLGAADSLSDVTGIDREPTGAQTTVTSDDAGTTAGASTTGSAVGDADTGGSVDPELTSTGAAATSSGPSGEDEGAGSIGMTGSMGFCGDGLVDLDNGEDCDGTPNCTATCTWSFCSNGLPEPGEACDDGNDVNNDACTNVCTLPVCGDGIVQAGEECDDQNGVNDDDCSDACALPVCGDGIVQAGEACDKGDANGAGSCSDTCTIVAAQTVLLEAENLNLVAPADLYNGSLGSMACTDFVVAANGIDNVKSVKLVLGIDATWIGDITVKLSAPNGQILTVLSRPGANLPDDGIGCCGDNSNLAATFPISLFDAAPTSAELMGSSLDNAQVICKDDGLCGFAPAPGAGPGKSFADFKGKAAPGTWRVCVGDAGQADPTVVQSIGLGIDKVI